MASDPILIIGASRSGTSLLARILSGSGMFLGADLESNHESRSLQAANRWVYLNADAGFDAPGPAIDELWESAFMRHAITRTLHAQIHGRAYWGWPMWYGWRSVWWGFKDPRTTFTLPFWLEVLPHARVIHMRRQGADVARSLMERRRRVELRWGLGRVDGLALVRQHRAIANLCATSRAASLAHWQHYVGRASRHVHDLGPARALEVNYETLLTDPAETCERLGTFLGRRVRRWEARIDPDGHTRLYPDQSV